MLLTLLSVVCATPPGKSVPQQPLGRLLTQTTVDSDNVMFDRGPWTTETGLLLYQRLMHQAAWQAAVQAARVVRETLQAERKRERAL